MPDLTVLSATSSSNRDNAGEGYETPPRGQLRGLGAADGFEWLYELDNCGDVYAVPLSSKHVARREEQRSFYESSIIHSRPRTNTVGASMQLDLSWTLAVRDIVSAYLW
jgi:hypothetical protein